MFLSLYVCLKLVLLVKFCLKWKTRADWVRRMELVLYYHRKAFFNHDMGTSITETYLQLNISDPVVFTSSVKCSSVNTSLSLGYSKNKKAISHPHVSQKTKIKKKIIFSNCWFRLFRNISTTLTSHKRRGVSVASFIPTWRTWNLKPPTNNHRESLWKWNAS